MTIDDLASLIDLTLLRPDATRQEIEKFIEQARRYPFATVCIPPSYSETAAKLLEGNAIKVGTVIGFPLGYQTSDAKLHEAKDAVLNGADEIDMVMNISAFKSGERGKVEDEISMIVSALHSTVTKVIIETCYLTKEEKVEACEIIIKSGADFVKTSTGFGPGGATVEDVRLLSETAGGRIRVKASGGIKTADEALNMLSAGADRIGTSSGVGLIGDFLIKDPS